MFFDQYEGEGENLSSLFFIKVHNNTSYYSYLLILSSYILVYNSDERSFIGRNDMFLLDTKVRELYERDRCSCAEIAYMAGCSETKMYHRLKNLGVEMRGRSEANQIFPDSLFMILYNLGLSASQVARILGIHASTVIKRLHTLNFPLRSCSVASAIRYSEKEFQRYFMTPSVLNCLIEIT